jgi:hypothetical protein
MFENPPSQDAARCPSDNDPQKDPRVSVIVNSFNGDNQTQNSQNPERNGEIVKWTRRAAKAAIVYSFLTFFLLIGSGYSIYETRNAVDAANRAADAASAQARTSEDTEKTPIASLRLC